jgi:hypothetical protein
LNIDTAKVASWRLLSKFAWWNLLKVVFIGVRMVDKPLLDPLAQIGEIGRLSILIIIFFKVWFLYYVSCLGKSMPIVNRSKEEAASVELSSS